MKNRGVDDDDDYDDDDDDDDDDNSSKGRGEFYIPVVFHNLKCYDAHFCIKYFEKRYTKRDNGNNPPTYDDVAVIPSTAKSI